MKHGLWLLLIIVAAGVSGCGTIAPQASDVPRVEFLFPMDGVTVTAGTDLQIGIVAQDSVGIARIELAIDDLPHQAAAPTELSSVPTFTVDMNWLARGAGYHALTAVAYRLDGTASDPAIIRVNVGS